jgi:DNA-binding NarL/FixJ family response regulator
MTLRIVLAEDSPLLRAGIATLISSDESLEVVAVCEDLDGVLEAVDHLVPDILLTDIRMPPNRRDEGIRAATYCRTHHPEMGVVLLSQYVDPAYVRALLEQGAQRRGYLLKERVADLHELVAALRIVAAGGSVIDPRVIEVLARARGTSESGGTRRLSAREVEVLGEMARGRSNASISSTLVITQRAVEKHINSIFAKLGVNHDGDLHPRVQAVLLYLSEPTE